MGIFPSIIVATLIISSVSLIGGLLLIRQELWTEKMATHLVGFAAGVMLSTAFLDLLPESLEDSVGGGNVFSAVFLGVLTFFFLERFVLWFHHHHEPHDTKPSALLILLGDGLHNFIDGVVIAATFLTNPALGVVTTLAIAAHEAPQEVADFSILIHGGMKKTQALLFNFLSALTAIIGAIGGFFYLETLRGLLPFFLAFTAGMFIYIACSDLIPDMHKSFQRQRSWLELLPFLLGIGTFWILATYLKI